MKYNQYICVCTESNKYLIEKQIVQNGFIVNKQAIFHQPFEKNELDRLNLSNLKFGFFKNIECKPCVMLLSRKEDASDINQIISPLYEEHKGDLVFSSSVSEFKYLSSLVLYSNELQECGGECTTDRHILLNRKLIGSDGWHSFNQCFEILNRGTSWVVMRNAEFLPDNFFGNDKDVDVLCEDKEAFIKLSNAYSRHGGIASYYVNIMGKCVEFDVRFVGDNYYDKKWQQTLLEKKLVSRDQVPYLSDEFLMPSLLYHAIIHKEEIKDRYKRLFSDYYGVSTEEMFFLKHLCNNLSNYMKKNGFKVVYPKDKLCLYSFNFYNLKLLEKSLRPRILEGNKDILKTKILNFYLKFNHGYLPKIIPSFLKVYVLWFLTRNDR